MLRYTGADNTIIGIYSFAALFVEGFYQLYVVVRRSINPHIAKMYREQIINQSLFNKKNKRLLHITALLMNLLLILGVYIISVLIGYEYLAAIPSLVIISAGISINSYYIILGNTMSQIGKPEIESMINLITVSVNLFLNIFLIQQWGGMIGAGLATSISYFVYSMILKKYVTQHFGLLLVLGGEK